MAGKYRLRTALRRHLPYRLTWLAPKGRDCGDHDWYRSEEETWRCYHCTVVTHEMPWTESELAARELEAEAMRIRAGVSER